MKTKENRRRIAFEVTAHYCMAFVGGFVGIFSVTLFFGSFGSAQTGNMISMLVSLLGGDLHGFILRLICLLIFFSAIAFSVLIGERCEKIKLVCVMTDMLMIVVLEVLPHDIEPVIYLYPISFAMAVQWQSFRGTETLYSATPFTTNNLRQFISAVVLIIEKGKEQRKSNALKALFYLCTVLSFASGIIAGFFACEEFDIKALWFCMIPLTAVLPLSIVLRDKKISY